MRQKLSLLGLAGLAILLATTTPADAANKEHQQMMADLRMLQEQSQLLQNLLGQVTDAIRAVNTRLDQQTETNRKAMADQKLVIDNLSNDVRAIREKLDDNNVRLGSLSQEVDALRQAVQQSSRPTAPAIPEPDAAPGSQPPTAPPTAGTTSAGTVVNSPTQMWNAAYADYTSGNFDLSILGFDAYIKTFPKSDKAPEAQVYICSSKPQSPATPLATPGCRILDEPYTQGVTRSCSDRQNFGPLYVPAGHYLLLGDNREDSQDGRCFGLIPKSWILGRAFARIWPLQRVGLL